MKSAVLLFAMLSGLLAGAMAAPIDMENRTAPTTFSLSDEFSGPAAERGIDVALPSAGDELLRDENQVELLTTEFTVDGEASEASEIESEGDSVGDGDEGSNSFRVPEPPPLTTIAMGLIGLALLAIRQNRISRKRRRKARPRPLTVLR